MPDSLDAELATLTDERPGTEPSPLPAAIDTRQQPALDLLIWDAPNIDMTLSTVIGARPTAASRPRFDAIAAWFVEGAGDPAAPGAPEVEACVFANIPPAPGTLQRWVEALRGFGYSVFARPKSQPDDDIDQDMLDHIDVRAHSHRLRRLVVFSGDGRNFAEPLEQLVREGTQVVVVAFSEVAGYAITSELLQFIDIEDVPGAFVEPLEQLVREGTQVVVVAFSEVAGYAITSELLQFIDIEDVPGAFVEPLDRVRLDALPPDGAWLRPTRSLRDFVSSFNARRDR